MGVIMDEMTLWEIIEGFERSGDLGFVLTKDANGWYANFGGNDFQIFKTRKEALISAITKLTVQ
jgi:hypothetical protein